MKKIIILLFLLTSCATANKFLTSDEVKETEKINEVITYNSEGIISQRQITTEKKTNSTSKTETIIIPEEPKLNWFQKFIIGVKKSMQTVFIIAGIIAVIICFIKFDIMGFLRTLLKIK